MPGSVNIHQAVEVVDQLLDDVDLPVPWSVDRFIDRLERHRGRPIDLCEFVWSPGQATGAWYPRHDHDIIAYPRNTSRTHQDHIILHEVGHLLCQHPSRCVLALDQARDLAPHLEDQAFDLLLGRTALLEEEHVAEWIATLLMARALTPTVPDTPLPDGPEALTRALVAAAFDQP